MSKFVIKPGQSEQWADLPQHQRPHYIVEVAENGEPLNVSEFYADRANALRAARRRANGYALAPEIVIETDDSTEGTE